MNSLASVLGKPSQTNEDRDESDDDADDKLDELETVLRQC